MKRLSAKLVQVGTADGYSGDEMIAHWCPGCRELHAFAVVRPQRNNAMWAWDSNVTSPSFVPSMNISWGNRADPDCDVQGGRCHYMLTKGIIHFLADCTHELVGQVVDLPDLPAKYNAGAGIAK